MRAIGLVAAFLVLTVLAWAMLSRAWPVVPVDVHVRWTSDLTDARRVELERRFQLTNGVHSEGTTWTYQLADSSTANIRAIVQDEQVSDTENLDRNRYRPEVRQGRSQMIAVYSVVIGSLGPLLLLGLPAGFRRTASLRSSWWPDLVSAMPSTPGLIAVASPSPRATAAAIAAGVLMGAAMTWIAGPSFWSSAGGLVAVYVYGYLVGSLLVARVEGLSLAVIRTVAGLMLASVGLLLSLALSVPWFVAPAALVIGALVLRGRAALSWPHEPVRFAWDGLAAGVLTIILLSPIVITFVYMASGQFPPVFYNVDTAYSLEKVHALVAANSFPPPSLSNLGVQRTYHYGTQAMAALISRSSGLLPHHSLFLIVLPVLTAGVVAAAAAVARYVAPALPRSVTVPLLLISTPSLSRPFWDQVGTNVWAAVSDSSLWGILSNEAQNVGGDFLILGSIAGIAAARSSGWMLPAFLLGSSVIFKTTAGIALVSGFALSEAWRAVQTKRLSPQIQLVGAVFAAIYGVFFLTSFESAFRVELYPFAHMREIVEGGRLLGFLLDVAWLFLPVLIVLTARIEDPEERSAPMLLMAVAPLLVMNTTRLVHVGQGGEGAGLDWVQISHSVPFLVHACALSLASRRWDLLGRPRRVAFLVTIALAIAPVAAAAAHYSSRLLRDPTSGNEFVDNRSLAQALTAIPTESSVIVTNDLRYPANNFSRDDRQMQIPALFGHQAFTANFSYEPVEDRRELQKLLQSPEWGDAIPEAARTYGWTHFVVRKDYVHPMPIPLEHVFENELYRVFRFQVLERPSDK